MAQITRKDIDRYRDDQEKYEAQQIAEQRRQEEALLQHIRNEATELGRRLESTPKWMQAIEKLRSEVLYILATESSREGEAAAVTVTVAISLSEMPWWWRRRWTHLARDYKFAAAELTKGLLEGGLKTTLETILPVAYAYCCYRGSTKPWELVVDFWPPKN